MAIGWQIGERIQNRWEVYEILKGGMGVVYLVFDHGNQNVYAAKTFRDEFFASTPVIIERFVQEAHAWINLDFHQNVTKARFVDTIAGKPYLFLEYISGGDLSHWISTPRLTNDLPQVLRFAVQFCDGMVHALSKGIEAHRDIKPQNCLITEDTLLKITDFGLAKVQTISNLRGTCAGTPEYMAPEQWDDFEKADERSDIYSFGSMLYEMLSSTPPFGKRPRVTIVELERRHVNKKPPALSSHPKSLQKVLETCLAKNQTNRFANFTELRKELAHIYKRLTNQHVPFPESGPALTVSDLITKGSSLGTLGKHQEELACYQRAIDLNPNEWRAWSNKGVALAALGQLDQALRCQERALAIEERIANIWSNKGFVLHALGREQESLSCCERALELNPHYARGWYNKGHCLQVLGRHADAVACYDWATELDPHYETAWTNKARSLRALSRFEESLNASNKALELNPRDVHALLGKASALNALGRSHEALALNNQALALAPMDAAVWCNRGVSLAGNGQSDEALASFIRAIELDPKDDKSWYNKGFVLFNLQAHEEALNCFEKARRLGNPEAEKTLTLCRELLRKKTP